MAAPVVAHQGNFAVFMILVLGLYLGWNLLAGKGTPITQKLKQEFTQTSKKKKGTSSLSPASPTTTNPFIQSQPHAIAGVAVAPVKTADGGTIFVKQEEDPYSESYELRKKD